MVFKVAAIVTRAGAAGSEVLVFDHPLDEGGIMVQVPAGTIEPDEPPEQAAVRELLEETGIRAEIVALAGIRDEAWEGEQRRRWVYLLRAPAGLPDEWPSRCDCGAPTRCYWLPFDRADVAAPQQPWLDMARVWTQDHPGDRRDPLPRS